MSMKIYQGRIQMTDIKNNFRLGMLAQNNFIEFNVGLLDQMWKAILGPGNGLSLADISMGWGRQML